MGVESEKNHVNQLRLISLQKVVKDNKRVRALGAELDLLVESQILALENLLVVLLPIMVPLELSYHPAILRTPVIVQHVI